MKIYEYKAEQLLPMDVNKAWQFFSSPENLSTITPPSLGFKILSDFKNEEIYSGMLINYRVKPLFGIPVNWQTEITEVTKPYTFTDKQIKGPYRLWEHKHYFIEKKNGVLVIDHVRYRLPFGIIGIVAHALLVRKKLKKIFSFRKITLENIFGKV